MEDPDALIHWLSETLSQLQWEAKANGASGANPGPLAQLLTFLHARLSNEAPETPPLDPAALQALLSTLEAAAGVPAVLLPCRLRKAEAGSVLRLEAFTQAGLAASLLDRTRLPRQLLDAEKGGKATEPGPKTAECRECRKGTHALERLVLGHQLWHRACFLCRRCRAPLRLGLYTSVLAGRSEHFECLRHEQEDLAAGCARKAKERLERDDLKELDEEEDKVEGDSTSQSTGETKEAADGKKEEEKTDGEKQKEAETANEPTSKSTEEPKVAADGRTEEQPVSASLYPRLSIKRDDEESNNSLTEAKDGDEKTEGKEKTTGEHKDLSAEAPKEESIEAPKKKPLATSPISPNRPAIPAKPQRLLSTTSESPAKAEPVEEHHEEKVEATGEKMEAKSTEDPPTSPTTEEPSRRTSLPKPQLPDKPSPIPITVETAEGTSMPADSSPIAPPRRKRRSAASSRTASPAPSPMAKPAPKPTIAKDLLDAYPDERNPFGSDTEDESDIDYDDTLNPFASSDGETAESSSSMNPFGADSDSDSTAEPVVRRRQKSPAPKGPPTPAARLSLQPTATQSNSPNQRHSLVEPGFKPRRSAPPPPQQKPPRPPTVSKKKRPAPPPPLPFKRQIHTGELGSAVEVEAAFERLDSALAALETEAAALAPDLTDAMGGESWGASAAARSWLALVTAKAALGREEAELVTRWREHFLDELHSDVEAQLRRLLEQPESARRTEDEALEAHLLSRLLNVIEQKNALVEAATPPAPMLPDEDCKKDEEKKVEKHKKKKLKLRLKKIKLKLDGGHSKKYEKAKAEAVSGKT